MSHSQSHSQALILGVGPGLGASVARRFGRAGFAVTIAARHEQKLSEIADQLRSEGIIVEVAAADASDPRAFRTTLERLTERVTPSVVVYNAAIVATDNVLTSDLDYLQNAYNVDAVGAIVAAQVFTPAMREAGAGTFLATGGSPGVDPQAAYATLSLGKAGLRAAVMLMHEELKEAGVHATSITVAGAIISGTSMAPERIAEIYWDLHSQPPTEWTAETVFDGQ